MIELVGLSGKRDARVRSLSGGRLRRLDLALPLVGDPELGFLDDPQRPASIPQRAARRETIREG